MAVAGLTGPRIPAAPAEPAADLPAPPAGMRWVGIGRVVVAVPETWSTGETRCLEPVADTVYVDGGVIADCGHAPPAAEVRASSSLAVLVGPHAARRLQGSVPIGEVAGHAVVEHPGCTPGAHDQCRRLFALPDLGVVLAARLVDDDGRYEQIRDSLRVLPAGLATVPLHVATMPPAREEASFVDRLARTIEDAGFRVEVETVPPSPALRAGSVAVTPERGSVVPEGATVTITVADAVS